MNLEKVSHFFTKLAQRASETAGHSKTFVFAVLLIVIWGACGPMFGYSDTWQLVINTSTTIITFLMVFLIQNTQNRDTEAMQIKLDEIIFRMENAQNALLDLEMLDERELNKIRDVYRREAERARQSGAIEQSLQQYHPKDEKEDENAEQ